MKLILFCLYFLSFVAVNKCFRIGHQVGLRKFTALKATYSRAPPVGKIKVEAVMDKFLSYMPIAERNRLFNQSTPYERYTDGFVFDGHIISYASTARPMWSNRSVFITELNILTDIAMFDNPYFRLQKNRNSTEFRDIAQKFYNSLSLGLGPAKTELEFLTHKKEFRQYFWSDERRRLMRIRIKEFQSPRMRDLHRAFYSNGQYRFRRFQSIKHTMKSFLKPAPCACTICSINVIR